MILFSEKYREKVRVVTPYCEVVTPMLSRSVHKSKSIGKMFDGSIPSLPTMAHHPQTATPKPFASVRLVLLQENAEWRRLDGEGCKEGIVLF